MTDATLEGLIERVSKWIEHYEDAPNWGGPTLYPSPLGITDIKALHALAALAKPDHPDSRGGDYKLVPVEPIEAQWSGLARAIMMWLDMHPKTPRALFDHLRRTGEEIPDWLRDEPEMLRLDHVPSKGTRCAIIYRAMLDATPPGIGGDGPDGGDGEAGAGWVYFNPGTGTEYARQHPIESGECCDASDIRPSTQMEDALNDRIQEHFLVAQDQPAAPIVAEGEREAIARIVGRPTLAQLRAKLVEDMETVASKRKGDTGLRAWARANGVQKSRVSEFLSGKRLPNDDILRALGCEWAIVRHRDNPEDEYLESLVERLLQEARDQMADGYENVSAACSFNEAADAILALHRHDRVGVLEAAGHFLLDRLVDHEVRMTSEEDAREWSGHVTPAMARFRAALSTDRKG